MQKCYFIFFLAMVTVELRVYEASSTSKALNVLG